MEDPGGMAGTVWLGEDLSVYEKLLIVWRWICYTNTGSGLCGCGGGVVEYRCVPFGVVQAVLYWWHCLWTSGGLLVGLQWSVKISWRMSVLEEEDGAVVGVS